jgi:hypothetical protein
MERGTWVVPEIFNLIPYAKLAPLQIYDNEIVDRAMAQSLGYFLFEMSVLPFQVA